jgi:regulatory protein
MAFAKPKPLNREELLGYALRLLGGRSLSVAELRQKLKQRAQEPGDIDPVVAQLKEYGYLNDEKMAEGFAASRRDGRGFGKQRVLSDLLKKRVAPKVAERAVGEAFAGVDETAMIEDYLARKYRTRNLGALLQEPAKLAGVYRRLRLAGFSSAASIRVLKRFAAEAEALEGLEDAGS